MLTCFLCEKTGNIVKKFNEERLEKCRKIQAFRRKKNLIYKDVVLPKSFQQRGYHLQCYDKFIILKNNNRKEFASTFTNGKVLINDIPPLKIATANAFKKNTASTSDGVEIPKLAEILQIDNTFDIDLKLSPRSYTMDEPNYVDPDISRGVILKSILTRKAPIKKDMTKDPMAFNSGMDLLRYGAMFSQPTLNFGEQKLGPKIVKTVSLTKDVCIFCGKEQRKIGLQVLLPEISKKDEYDKVLDSAKAMEDGELLDKILKSNNILSCHSLCRLEYKNKYQKITIKNCDKEDMLIIKNLQNKAFQTLCLFIDNTIIEKNKTCLLADLFDRYKAILFEIQNATTILDLESHNLQSLQEEILNRYADIIKITSKSKKKVVYKIGQTNFDMDNDEFKHDKLAFELRNEIGSMKRKRDGNQNGNIPEKLLRFVTSLIQGPSGRKIAYEDSVKIKSLCENIISGVNLDD